MDSFIIRFGTLHAPLKGQLAVVVGQTGKLVAAGGRAIAAGRSGGIDVHPYYIRFSGDSGGWLDIVTRERMGEGVVTMPVSVKAMHNWASHAVKFDPEVFFARLIKEKEPGPHLRAGFFI